MSENLSSADNQQERLIKIGWVTGFVDGEGCFSIGVVKQPSTNVRKGYKTGYQIFPKFAVTQGRKSISALEELREFFGVGKIYLNRRHDNHKEHLCNFMVLRREDLFNVILPFFRKHPLRSAKRKDFEKFAECLELMRDNHHLTHEGLIAIAQIAQTMNRQKPREVLIRILRDYTSDAPREIEGMKI